MKSVTLRFLTLLILFMALVGCSKHSRYFDRGVEALQKESYDEAVMEFSRALKEKPDDPESQARFLTTSSRAAQKHLQKGRQLQSDGLLVEAASEFRLAFALDSTLAVAQSELIEIESRQKTREILADAENQYRARRLPQAKNLVTQVLERDPTNATALLLRDQIREDRNIMVGGFELAVTSKEPVTLKFKDAKLQEVFKILNKLSGINFIFDEDLANKNVTLFLEDASFSQALELLMKMNQLGSRVLNPKTVIIYANTKEKQKQYEDQVIQTFYLSSVDAKKAVNMLRTMLTLRKVYVHEELNALVVRDTPDVIKLVGEILQTADLSDSEVVFDLELIEVTQGDLQKLGLKLSPYSVSAGAAKGGSLVSSGLVDATNLISNLNGLDTLFTLPTATFDLSKTLTDTDILATPKIRVKNREKAKVHVGSREPTLTSTASGTGGFVSSSVQYIDVGVKVDVEPTIQLDGSVLTKLRLEVSSKGDQLTSSDANTVAFTINTTNAETALILKDGERTIIGGLIRSYKSKTRTKIPILGDIPLLGALFTNFNLDDQKREILLSVTPHIVKNINLPGVEAARIWSGG
ncbi:MAG: type II secretion system protein, partial [Desulfuromonadales bacterium]|nr:type II secretion system protein [Desulfuromonadales bacterium]